VLVSEVDPDLWGIGGVPYSVARGPLDPGQPREP
jgi:phenylpyruvate tautomerase PptA (4-oxalocrotonate tautomerase family)